MSALPRVYAYTLKEYTSSSGGAFILKLDDVYSLYIYDYSK